MLYVVSLPIGHPEDLSFRAVRVLKAVNMIVAEEPSSARALLSGYAISTPITSYHTPSLEQKAAMLLSRLRLGESMALVCEAGTPVVCDPGFRLVKAAVQAGIPVLSVPGPSAALAAVPVSALPSEAFYFHGMIPAGRMARRKLFEALRRLASTLILFERDDRLTGTLREARRVLGNRRVVIAIDMTKPSEQFVRGRLDEVLMQQSERPAKGELTVLIEGRSKKGRS